MSAHLYSPSDTAAIRLTFSPPPHPVSHRLQHMRTAEQNVSGPQCHLNNTLWLWLLARSLWIWLQSDCLNFCLLCLEDLNLSESWEFPLPWPFGFTEKLLFFLFYFIFSSPPFSRTVPFTHGFFFVDLYTFAIVGPIFHWLDSHSKSWFNCSSEIATHIFQIQHVSLFITKTMPALYVLFKCHLAACQLRVMDSNSHERTLLCANVQPMTS